MTLQQTDLNVSPFFDDYDETKNYQRILFRPRSVQARELNQAQTILQDQINRLGRHLFEDGAMVIPGGINTTETQTSIGLTFTGGAVFADIAPYLTTQQLMVKSLATGQTAKIMKAIDATGSDPVCFFLEYQSSGDDGSNRTFGIGSTAQVYYTQNGTDVTLANLSVTVIGTGMWVKVLSGVYFIRGFLVRSDDQDYVVSKFTNDATAKVGFVVTENVVDETIDNTLYSNAIGTPNFKAPGASRLQFVLTLDGKVASDPDDPKFVELVAYENGELQRKVDYTQYAEIAKTLAQRTYETNGDYTVNPFQFEVREHLKSLLHPDGVYSAVNGGLESKYVVRVKPGIAYVQGYRVQNIGTQNLAVDKARDSLFVNNSVLGSDYGSYIIVQNIYSMPDIDITKRYQFTLVDGTTVIGTFCIRAIRKEGSTTYRLYIFDTQFTASYGLNDAKKLKYSDASNLFRADLVSSDLYQGSTNNLVYRLPYDVIKTLKNNGASDTTYTVMRSFNVSTNGAGTASISLSASEVFSAVNSFEYFIALTGAANTGTVFDPTGIVTLGGTPVGRSMTIALGGAQANKTIKVIAPVIKQNPAEKTKTLQTATETLVFTNVNQRALAHADIFGIVSVIDVNSINRMADFTYDDGQRANWYQNGVLQTVTGANITNTITVTYQYFAHSPGDYFSVDSYSGLDRASVPKFRVGSLTYNLADTIDFRPLKDSTGVFTSSTVFGEINKPGDNVRFDLFYYQPRIDSLFVDINGDFGVKKGVPADAPAIPEVPALTLRLADLFVPAYTEDATKIQYNIIDNRRYTMRDIGKLETRIRNVEYYTSLNLLESKNNRTQIIDPVTGNDRFKNGFSADGFSDLSLADINDTEWSASLDFDNNLLRPTFAQNATDTGVASGTNYAKRNDLGLMAYTNVVETDQPYATKTSNINPYAVFTWVGKVKLTPSSDFWKDVQYNQPIINNITLDYTGGLQAGSVSNVTSFFWGSWGNQFFGAGGNYITTTTTTTTTSINNSYSTNSVDNLLASVIIPYMRPITISFELSGFRPFTRMYPFWDGVSVSSQVTPQGGALGGAVLTDAAGAAKGTYLVPNTTTFRFSTGTGVFRWTDSPTDTRDPNMNFSAGETQFTSGGILETRQVTITNTRTMTAVVSSQSSSTTSQNQQWFIAVNPVDPIAQTFRINSSGGAYITKIDIFFATKAAAIPVRMQIRPVINGIPSSTDVFPFGELVLNPDQVNVSADGSVPTSFVFDDPIYLLEGPEFAVVLLADTQEYNVYIAEMGGTVIGKNQTVAKQPHIGVFMTSSNGSTWTPQQTQDLTFRVWRADFAIGSTSQIVYRNLPQTVVPLGYNAFNTVTGSSTITVKALSHGLKAGDKVTFSGVIGDNGFTSDAINIQWTVVSKTIDSFTIVAGSNATATGTFGGGVIRMLGNYPFSDFFHNAQTLVPSGTDILWEYSYLSQTSRSMTAWKAFQPKNTFALDDEGVVTKTGDFQVRATMTSTKTNLSPSIDMSGMGTMYISRRIDSTLPVFNYVSRQVRFDNPNTEARFYIGTVLPGTSTMKVYYKPIVTTDKDLSTVAWVEMTPVVPLVNDAKNAVEYEYRMSGIGSFVGYKVKISLFGPDSTQTPLLTDFRSIALA